MGGWGVGRGGGEKTDLAVKPVREDSGFDFRDLFQACWAEDIVYLLLQ